MPYRILFIASLHHPEALLSARKDAHEAMPLFPPSMSQHFWEKAMRKRGHILDVFYRNLPGGSLEAAPRTRATRHTQRITPSKVMNAVSNRVPPEFKLGARARNHELIGKVRAFKPDILWMAGDNTIIYPQTLESIKRESGCLLVYACGTSPIVFSHPIDRRAAPLYDLVLTSDYYHGIQWLELGAKRMECLPLAACDPGFHHPYMLTDDQRAELACDIAFVGTLVPSNLYSRRVRALEALSDFDLGIWSVHEVPRSLRQFVRGKALGEDMERILSAAKICFNTHGDFVYYGGNLRLFEVAGAGVFQITDDLPGTREWFPQLAEGATIATYTNTDDLREKVSYYLNHDDEREAIAKRGQQHVYAHHTYDHRAERFEQLVEPLMR